VEDVDRPEEPLDRRMAGAAPRLAPVVRERQEPQLQRHGQPAHELRDAAQALRARRRERDDLVTARGDLREPAQRLADVVADPGRLVRERADVERDPHETSNETKRMPR
jgi:hypothetical protein